ncbi:MAG: amino acid adenylation domain-containing protein [Rhodospirillaceae bacterium]
MSPELVDKNARTHLEPDSVSLSDPVALEEGAAPPEELDSQPRAMQHKVSAIARIRPNALAVVTAKRSMKYAALAAGIQAVQAVLSARAVKKGEPIGLCLEAAPELAVGYLGILAAGGAVMPLDPALPSARLRAMAVAAGARLVLVHGLTRDRLNGDGGPETLDLDCLDCPVPVTSLPEDGNPDQLALLYHTSGSTGQPKPVAISHGTLTGRMESMADWFGIDEHEVVCGASSLAFDPFIQQLFFPLSRGGTLWLPGRDGMLDAAGFWRDAVRYGLTHLNLVPSQVEALLDSAPIGGVASLRRVVMGGERMPPSLPARICARLGEVPVYNMYGPTEGTVDATGFRIDPARMPARIPDEIPIGRPLPGCRVRILDAELRRVPPGTPGELCIGGAGLAMGYLGKPEETSAKFIPDPFGPPGARLYRTGDLACWREDGEISFIGRRDEQVKVRGQRLELGEVEAALRRQPGVQAAAACLWAEAPGGPGVVAYLTGSVDVAAVGRGVAEILPAAAVPVRILVLPTLPRLPSGKIDRHALPTPDLAPVPEPGSTPAGPTPAGLEQAIAAIWAELLGGRAPDRTANLFEAGAHSLLVPKAQARLSVLAGREIPVVDIFRYPSIAAFAACLAGESALLAPAPSGVRADSGAAAIAIVGLAFRFPGARDRATFWNNLIEAVDSIRHFDRAELEAAGTDPALMNHPDFVPANAELPDLDRFDPVPFGYTPADAAEMDPQQRLLLETAWHALEDAACNPAGDGPVGVFAGTGFNAYLLDNLHRRAGFAGGPDRYFLVVNNDKDFAATRLAYKLGLTGPAMTIASACSTGLATVAQAVDSLRAGRCRVALAGSASAGMFSSRGYIHTDGGIASRRGRCRPFDAEADGTVGGAGAGVIVLKRLADALRDRDTIHAVIRGIGISNDGGARAAFSAPSVDGQAAALRAALADADLPPTAIGYVEGHGTATPLGDPIEVAALNLAYGSAAPGSIPLGSIKGNIGHLDAAAGIAGLIKTVLVVKHGLIPPTAHFTRANPRIPFADGPFRPVVGVEPWPRTGESDDGATPRRAAVSSFGMGGTNLHIILEQAPPCPAPSTPEPALPRLLMLSAATASARDALAAAVAGHLEHDPSIALTDIAHSLHCGRKRLRYRRVAVACNPAGAAVQLRGTSALDNGELIPGAGPATVALLFPGQGAQHPGMGRDLYRSFPLFRAVVDEAAARLAEAGPADLTGLLLAAPNDSVAARRLADTAMTQPALFTVEYGIARLLQSFGVVPSALAGHSLGEYVAATLAGVMSFADALALVTRRGRLMASAPPGVMLAVSLPEAEIRALLAREFEPGAAGIPEIATINAPRQSVLAGDEAGIARIEQALIALDRPGRRLPVSRAFHCALMDPILEDFGEAVSRVTLRPATIPMLSNLSGAQVDPAAPTEPAYWVRHLRGTVRFVDNLRHLLTEPARVLVEAGPGVTLTRLARAAGAAEARAIATQPQSEASGQDGAEALIQSLSRLWLHGVEPDLAALEADRPGRRVPLPPYPFERKRYWIDPSPSADSSAPGAKPAPILAPGLAAVEHPASVTADSILRNVRGVWREALGLPDIAYDDDFLELGGDSLVAVRIVARLRETLGTEVPAALIFSERTVAGLARALAAAAATRAPTPAPVREEGWL